MQKWFYNVKNNSVLTNEQLGLLVDQSYFSRNSIEITDLFKKNYFKKDDITVIIYKGGLKE
jgi:hypothetical protein